MSGLFDHLPKIAPKLKAGEGNGKFLADLAENVSDDIMRERWRAGEYGKPPTDWAKFSRRMVGRKE